MEVEEHLKSAWFRWRKYHRLGDHGYSLLEWKASKTLHVSADCDAVFPYYLRNYREVNMIRAVFIRQSIWLF